MAPFNEKNRFLIVQMKVRGPSEWTLCVGTLEAFSFMRTNKHEKGKMKMNNFTVFYKLKENIIYFYSF